MFAISCKSTPYQCLQPKFALIHAACTRSRYRSLCMTYQANRKGLKHWRILIDLLKDVMKLNKNILCVHRRIKIIYSSPCHQGLPWLLDIKTPGDSVYTRLNHRRCVGRTLVKIGELPDYFFTMTAISSRTTHNILAWCRQRPPPITHTIPAGFFALCYCPRLYLTENTMFLWLNMALCVLS